MTPTPPPGDAPTPSVSAAAPPLRLAYGTNGLTDLRLTDALTLLSDLGYDGVALTLDHMHLDPLAPGLAARTARVADTLRDTGLAVAIETGARYVLDPLRKHHPTLIDPDPDARAARTDLLRTAVRVGADLGATAVHCFSGIRDPGSADADSWQRLATALDPVAAAASDAGLPLAVEPEPGHLLSDLAGFHHLRTVMGAPDPDVLGLTLDIGHCQCLEPESPADCVRAAAPWTRHVQLEDMRRGVHEHLPFGDGEIDFPPVLAALRDTAYQGLVSVELPRHSHAGPDLARTSLHFLRSQLRLCSEPSAPAPDRVPAVHGGGGRC
ncbi:sugar phosphate isomerase/epimerase family protein [Streptomyces sp. NPDC053542]|uniref:sugar phosphate isomerase/epimerase family protein n=1 Tax=Streptomyces sp. NPDC053542 TaxID=3365710 RepID=UPI0037D75D59